MQETEFINLCDYQLNRIADLLEKKDQNAVLDIDCMDGVLDIEIIKTGQQYVVNRNSGNQKIWYSSPFTGADYFAYDDIKNAWLNDLEIDLLDKLLQELEQFKILENSNN